MSIPEVNRILGVQYLPSSQFDGPSSYDVGSESSEEEGSKTSINSSSTITVSPTFTQETFFQTFDSSGLPSRDTMAERLYIYRTLQFKVPSVRETLELSRLPSTNLRETLLRSRWSPRNSRCPEMYQWRMVPVAGTLWGR